MSHNEEDVSRFTPFWPLCLMAISLVAFLGWQVTAAAQQYIAFLRLADQQAVLVNQAAQAEAKLQAMMMDLLKLSMTDPDAKAIVNKYGVKYNPAAPVKLPEETPKPLPDSKANAEI